MAQNYQLNYLEQLEAESIHILREAAAEAQKPVMLYSIGKDSSVLLHLASKAFLPGKIPFPLMHVDTGYKFREMTEFRDKQAKKIGFDLIVQKNQEPAAKKMKPEEAHTDRYIYYKKTKPLLEGLQKHEFDLAFGGARRDEEKSRAKERIFSVRSEGNIWDPKNQRPELWHLYNSRLNENQTMRVFPLSNWTEIDIWRYIKKEKIAIVPLYYAKKREVIVRNGVYLRLDEFVKAKPKEKVKEVYCRYRTLGCSPSTGAIPSRADTLDKIITEIFASRKSERSNRAIDNVSDTAIEDKKREGYF